MDKKKLGHLLLSGRDRVAFNSILFIDGLLNGRPLVGIEK